MTSESLIILGISAYYHDSAAALLIDGEIVAAAQEERFSRKKHDASFPVEAIKFCLSFASVELSDVDAIAFYDKPFLKFERLLETYYAFAPRGLRSFVTAVPVWLKEKIFLKREIWSELRDIGTVDKKKMKLLFPEHHLSHAASAFYPSSYREAAILTIDGVGEWATALIAQGQDHSIAPLKQLDFPHSLGLFYSSFTYYCGFKVNAGEYKLMGLAPYGDPDGAQTGQFIALIKEHLIDIRSDGSLFLHQSYFRYATGLKMVSERKWERLFGFPRRQPESELTATYCNLALAAQRITEDVVLLMAREAKRLTGSDQLCLAGGVALNCVANGKLSEAGLFKELFITPAAGDAGGALGAAYAAHHIYYKQGRQISTELMDALKGAYLGPKFSPAEIRAAARRHGAHFIHITDDEELLEKVAEDLSRGKVIGWFQGRMEFGPRALGARSILADARNPEMQRNLNLKVKFRETFRPFAPIVLAEEVADYFEHQGSSPYMLLAKQVKKARTHSYPSELALGDWAQRLAFVRSDLPAVTHVDYSARLQTVHQQTNPRLWRLLHKFKNLTGYSVLVNTSFNLRGEPIVRSPEDAYQCFQKSGIDVLVMENFVFEKQRPQDAG